ncbi:effector-associated constant component EACC1 [Candidatus Frankia alpina]|uniref:Uncharacterized protein n=1 Tax=Candidatus Frankia alpina TaxID=2699483 RepID=A0A4S5B710_9ACTN|nr:hypothetical protein [Candidatus Frankia alpina]THJ25821.1 hypothetical protein E7Y31_23175 [Candidatus Frankia alpina]
MTGDRLVTRMDVVVGSTRDLRSLHTWLRRVEGLAVEVVPAAAGPGEQGGSWELLSVAFGSGGVGIAVLQTVQAWLETRRSTIRIRVRGTGVDREVELDTSNVADVLPLLEKMVDGAA